MRPIVSLLLAIGLLAAAPSKAEVPEVRFAQQFSMGYLQFNVMNHLGLLQKHAAALGIPDVKITYVTTGNLEGSVLAGDSWVGG